MYVSRLEQKWLLNDGGEILYDFRSSLSAAASGRRWSNLQALEGFSQMNAWKQERKRRKCLFEKIFSLPVFLFSWRAEWHVWSMYKGPVRGNHTRTRLGFRVWHQNFFVVSLLFYAIYRFVMNTAEVTPSTNKLPAFHSAQDLRPLLLQLPVKKENHGSEQATSWRRARTAIFL